MSRMLRSSSFTGVFLVAAAASALALAGCASGSGAGSGGYGADASTAPDAASGPTGTWGDAATSGEPSLVLGEDGTLTGTDGCNRLRGGWTEDGDAVTFDQVASTRMACPDVDTWLSTLATGTVSGATLTVFDASGTEIGTLSRGE